MQKKYLVIVESPAKIKTLKRFLGPEYIFESSYGHIRDLPAHEFGIDIENDFEPSYTPLIDKKAVVQKLKKLAKECDTVYLSPDPDREGEAIAWHISQLLSNKTDIQRVSFNSITKEAVREAISHPREINMALVNAQQARRLLDRLVGYTVSPLLSRKLGRHGKNSVSAGRVQSAALKIVVDRERAIAAFVPCEYWNISAWLKTDEECKSFSASLYSVDGKRVEKEPSEKKDRMTISDGASSAAVKSALENCSDYIVQRVDKKEKKRQPEAPFITSTLQQEASRHFRFSPSRTMQIAQELYEGIDLGHEAEGLITYMRTDSVRIVPEALNEVRSYINKQYGASFLPEKPRLFHVKKSAQDAHEAIRPTQISRDPESIKQFLSHDQYRLYTLIWKRLVASQMTPAIYDTVSCDIQANSRFVLRATGSQIKESGFLHIYEEKQDEEPLEEENNRLPDLGVDQSLLLQKIDADQAFTRPPPRFTEASLIKELEKSGIGRPSTYATIMKKISAREYTVKEKGRLKPTELGFVVTGMLEENFQDLMNIGFTASLEDALEEIAENQKEWKKVLSTFWEQFSKTLEHAKEHAHPPKIMTDEICPECQSPLQKIWSQSRFFLGCSKYPDCSYTTSLEEAQFDKSEYRDDFDWEQPCPKCQTPMKVRFGKFGAFLGCTKYPECRGIVSIPKKGEVVGHPCPAVGCEGTLVQRRSRFGKPFWSCTSYPDCDVIGNSIEQVDEKFYQRPQTAYVKKKSTKKKATAKKTTKKATRKKTTTKKSTTKKTTKKTVKKKSAEE